MSAYDFALPTAVSVLTRRYRVTINNELAEFGECNNVQGLISVNFKRCETPEIVARTFYHEIGHAFAWESGLSSFMTTSTEEMFVENLSALLCQLRAEWGTK